MKKKKKIDIIKLNKRGGFNMKEKNLFSRLASGLCLLLSILLITTFFMPVYKISLPASELVEKESSVSFSNFDIIMATTYDSFEDYIGQDAEETLTKLAAYSAAKSDDQTLLFVVMAHAVLIVLSLIALIVSIVGVCKRGTGAGSITMGVLLTLVGILFAVFVNMTENYSMASGVYVALVFSIVFLVLSIVGKILRTKNKKA